MLWFYWDCNTIPPVENKVDLSYFDAVLLEES